MPDLAALKGRLTDWLFEQALPLWRRAGVDAPTGAFIDALDPAAKPCPRPFRARVQARQVYVYCWAGAQGWNGDWRGAASAGFDAFLARHGRPDGLYRTQVAVDGSPADETAITYDQAFALFAFCAAAGQLADRRQAATEAAARLLAALSERRSGGGWAELGDHPFQANANMHLFEATLAWELQSADAVWTALSDGLAELALSRFIDPQGGFLREFFDAAWAPAPGTDGRIVEPGHQFEWAWLLDRWGRRRGDARGRAAAARLYRIGADHGVDHARGVAVDRLSDDMSVLSPWARLWPQTERLRAALWFGDRAAAAEAAGTLLRYADTEVAGLWRDRLDPQGRFVDEPAPASSLYHIVGAVDALMEAQV